MRLPGESSSTSRCAWSGKRPAKNAQTFMSVVAQAVEPQPRASSRDTSSFVRMSVSSPPSRARPHDREEAGLVDQGDVLLDDPTVLLGTGGVAGEHRDDLAGSTDQLRAQGTGFVGGPGAVERAAGVGGEDMGTSGSVVTTA